MTRQRKVDARTLSPLFLALLLGATPALAQPETVGSSSAPTTEQVADTPAASQSAPAPSEPASKDPGAGTSSKSPFDYRSSEKISEDVPVSFPVDI